MRSRIALVAVGLVSLTCAACGGHLYAMNGNVFNSGSNNISAFTINADGSLSLVAGSPFAAGSNAPRGGMQG